MSGLDRFFSILEGYRKTLSWAIGGSAILPLIASFAGLSPIWPTGTPIVTSLFVLFCIILSFQFFERAPKRKVNAIMKASFSIIVGIFVVYLYLFSRFVYEIPTNDELVYLGCGWSETSIEVSDVYGIDLDQGCPGNYKDIFAAFNYEAEVVWWQDSLTYIRIAMLVLWVGIFSAISVFVSTFLVYQSRR